MISKENIWSFPKKKKPPMGTEPHKGLFRGDALSYDELGHKVNSMFSTGHYRRQASTARNDMIPETKTCQNCTTQFTIAPEDFAFYERIKVPAPTWCPGCRLQRRLAWRNEIAFHHRNCDFCRKNIIALYPQNAAFPVYCRDCWWSDKWDGRQYGRDYDWSRPFFNQFFELQQNVPAVALQVARSVNCDYANQITDCKNAYLLNSASDCEDCYYSYRVLNSKNIFDSSFLLRCENCYYCTESLGVSRSAFVQNCADSLDTAFCYDVRGSHQCFMSSNLRRASHVFRNRRLSKQEYEREIQNVDLGSYRKTLEYEEEFKKLSESSIHAYADMKNTVNSTGQIVTNAKDCKSCFSVSDLENCSHCVYLNNAKDCRDINNGCCTMELAYEVSTTGVKCANIKLSADVWPEAVNVSYCNSCRNGSSNLFGCVGLKKSQFCILNKQYSKEEYDTLVPKIIQHMNEMPYLDAKGRIYKYGEFFPIELSFSPYNESPAQDYFPLTKEKAEAQGYVWREAPDKQLKITTSSSNLSDHIKDTDDAILSEIIGCEHAGRCNERCTIGFRIIAPELKFHRERNLALPRICPNCRNYQRLLRQNPFTLWKRNCLCAGTDSEKNIHHNLATHFHGAKHCPNEFETSYAPERKEIVYCESCYNSEVA